MGRRSSPGRHSRQTASVPAELGAVTLLGTKRYSALADRSETKGARERLSKHLMKKYIEGEKDEHRLTVEGLSYLRNLDREIPETSYRPSGPPAVSAKSCAALF
jgi:hypothetical protein